MEDPQGMLESADTLESADSAGQNHSKLTLEQLNFEAKQRREQRENNEKVEEPERTKADTELEIEMDISGGKVITKNTLSNFIDQNYSGNKEALKIAENYLAWKNAMEQSVFESELKNKIDIDLKEQSDLSTADKIKNFKEQLTQQGKSPREILQTLITQFEDEPAVNTWVENWKNFLKLYQYAENKSPVERKAIQSIISGSDFTKEHSFDLALEDIIHNSTISDETKIDLQEKFGTKDIQTVDDMDTSLRKISAYKEKIESQIKAMQSEQNQIESEISTLEDKIRSLPPNDPERKKLDEQLKHKKETLNQTNTEVSQLEQARPQKISFELREGIEAVKNADGTRFINIAEGNFPIQLPDNRLFMGMKNLRSINVVFPFITLGKQGMADTIFTTNILPGSIPTKDQRDLGHVILSSLGYDDTKILSQSEITQLSKDLSILKKENSNSTGQEDLAELGIWDIENQTVSTSTLTKVLKWIRANRGQPQAQINLKKFLK